MAKPVQTPPTAGRSGGTRSYWVRSLKLGPTPQGTTETGDDAAGGRFVEPLRLDAKQRDNLLQLLRKLRVGDTDGREIFLAAIEYDLAAYKDATAAEPSPPQPPARAETADDDRAVLTCLADALRSLREHIDGLDAATRDRLLEELHQGDRFQRGYDARYLTELRCELELLEQACAAPGTPPASAAPPAHSLSAAGRRLLSRLAEAFADCFEAKPTTAPNGPFAQTLAHLFEITAIDLPLDQATLEQILPPD